MADAYAQSTLYYDAEGSLNVVQVRDAGGGAEQNSTTKHRCIPAGVPTSDYEIRIIASGDTSTVTRNDASDWSNLSTVKNFISRLTVPDTSPAGTYDSSVTAAVEVRKITNPSDRVTGNVILRNHVIVTAPAEGSLPENAIAYSLIFPGQDQSTGTALIYLYSVINNGQYNMDVYSSLTPGNTLKIDAFATGIPSGTGNITTELHSWEPFSYTGGTATYYLQYPNTANIPSSGQVAGARSAAGSNGGTLIFKVTLRHRTTSAVLWYRYFKFRVESVN